VAVFLVAVGLVRCGDGSAPESKPTVLAELSEQVRKGGLVDRLDSIDRRLGNLEKGMAELTAKVDAGVRVAAPSGQPAAGGTEAAAGVASGAQAGEAPADAGQAAAPAATEEFKLTYPEPESPVTIVVWHAYRGKEKEAFEECARTFAARFPKFVVDAQEVPFSALRDKLVVTIPRGTGPDVFVYAHNNIGDWLLKGQILVPLSSLIEQYDSFESLARFLPDTVKALGYDGSLYGLPLAFKSHALFYNKALVKGDPPDTVPELVNMAVAASKDSGEGEDRIYGLVYDAGLLYNHALWTHAFGGTILDDAGNAHLDTPEMLQSLELVRSFVADSKILPDLNDSMATFLFNSNKVAFVIKGPWFLGEIDPSVQYGVALLPTVAEGKWGKPFLGSEGVFLSACARNREAAFQFMRYLVSEEAARIRYVKGQQLVANKSVYEDAALSAQANPALEVFRKQANNTVIMSAMPQMQAVWSTADNAIRNVIFGGADPKAALSEAQVKVDHDISNMGK
jgi:arabinogalactan oligomer/maltooligosaccharide transport system substrate-binding protein